MVVRRKEPLDNLARDVLGMLQSLPELVGRGKGFQVIVAAGREIVLDDPVAIRGISELKTEDLGIFFGLLEAVTRVFVGGFGFYDSNRKVRPISEEVVGALLRFADRLVAGDDNTTVGKGLLFGDAIVVPRCRVELREDVLTTGVSFSEMSHLKVVSSSSEWASSEAGHVAAYDSRKWAGRGYSRGIRLVTS